MLVTSWRVVAMWGPTGRESETGPWTFRDRSDAKVKAAALTAAGAMGVRIDETSVRVPDRKPTGRKGRGTVGKGETGPKKAEAGKPRPDPWMWPARLLVAGGAVIVVLGELAIVAVLLGWFR